jgi:hypothetical protein
MGLFWPYSALAQTPNAFSGYATLAECKAFADEHANLGQRAAGYFCAGELRALAYVVGGLLKRPSSIAKVRHG